MPILDLIYATEKSRTHGKVLIYYVNGMRTSHNAYCGTRGIIKEQVTNPAFGIGFNESNIRISGFYNESPTELIAAKCNSDADKALAEASKQAWYDPSKYTSQALNKFKKEFCPLMDGIISLGGDFAESYTQRQQLATILGFTTIADAQSVNALAADLLQQLRYNRRIIIIAHSQGNLFVSQALRKLLFEAPKTERPGKSIEDVTKEQILNGIGVIWVASPVEHEEGFFTRVKKSAIETNLICPGKFEPTCFSTHVSIELDPVARLRYISKQDQDQRSAQLLTALALGTPGVIATAPLSVPALALLDTPNFIVSEMTKHSSIYESFAKRELIPSSVHGDTIGFKHHDMDNGYLGTLPRNLLSPLPGKGLIKNSKPWEIIRDSIKDFKTNLKFPGLQAKADQDSITPLER